MILQSTAQNTAGPFAALSLIVAPAILTNACTVLLMSTSNRLARAVDLSRELADKIDAAGPEDVGSTTERRIADMEGASERSILLLQALRAIYAALAGYASATFIALIATLFAHQLPRSVSQALELCASGAAAVGVGGIIWAAAVLLAETRIAARALRVRIDARRARR
jgi:hypothetical protein